MATIPYQMLTEELGRPDALITDVGSFEAYFHDATTLTARPSAVLFPRSTDEVVTAVRFCRKHGIPITPRGAGTGLSGGCVPSRNALVLSTERIDHLRINRTSKTAICGPGVITKRLLDEAAPLGLTYPPDPASYTESTIGGNVAEGAGGLRCKRFGVTKDYVLGLVAVTSDGEVLKTGCYNANRGFALGDLLIASEGTLAIITEVTVRLIPIPARGTTILAAFGTPHDAAQTVADLTSEGIIPNVLEYLDGDVAACSNEYEKVDGLEKAAGLLLIETAGEMADRQASQVKRICERNHVAHLSVEPDLSKAEQLWKVRRNISKAVKQMAKIRISEDVAVPVSRFPVLVDFVSRMNQDSPLRINSFGHAGDGNLHVNFLSMAGSNSDLSLIDQGVETLMERTIELNGTLTGEHGIGLAKRQFLGLEFDPSTLGAMRTFKTIFDPENALNPGKLFPDS